MKAFIGLLVLVLLVAGCAQSTTYNTGDPFVGGTEGLTMEFITGSPPDEIFDNGQYPFTVSVKLENKGEYDIEENEGFIDIKGISPDEFGVSSADLKADIPSIRGTRKNVDGSVIQGFTEVVTFDQLKYQRDNPGNLLINNFRVRACYDYETESISSICIKKENIDGLSDNEICQVNADKQAVNSGAPIQVISLSENSRGKKGIQVTFDVGQASASSQDKWFPQGDNSCDDRVDNLNMYKVEVEVDPIINGRYSANCALLGGGNKGTVTMFNGEPRKVTCSFDTGDQDNDFETPINIHLRYRYLEYIEKPLLIKDLGTEDE